MGVTYKFTDDVVSFVIEQKRQDPNLSCRKLTAIVQKEFQIEASKSAINTILKSSQLSSPIGRRSRSSAKNKKFEIPNQKKSEIFGKEYAPPVKPLPAAPPVAKKVVPAVKTPGAGVSANEILCDGMGAIFLKAAEWELGISQTAGNVLKDYVTGFSPEDICAASQALIFLPVFGFQRPEDLARYSGQGLWLLNGLSTKFDYHSLVKILQHVHDQSVAGLKISNEIQQSLSEIAQIKIILEDGTGYSIDGEFRTLLPNNVQSEIYNTQHKILSNLSKCLIHNLSPLILNHAPGETCLSKEFHELIASFNNAEHKKIASVSLWDRGGQEMASFDMIPVMRRIFVTALWPRQKEFDLLAGASEHNGREIYLEEINKRFAFEALDRAKINMVFPHENIRAFWIQGSDASGREQQAVLLTNASQDEMPDHSVVGHYIKRWPNIIPFTDENREQERPAESLPEIAPADIRSTVEYILTILNKHCLDHFFPLSRVNGDVGAMISRFFALPGHWKQTSSETRVRIISPENAAARMELVYAAHRLNEREVLDPQGRRLWVELA